MLLGPTRRSLGARHGSAVVLLLIAAMLTGGLPALAAVTAGSGPDVTVPQFERVTAPEPRVYRASDLTVPLLPRTRPRLVAENSPRTSEFIVTYTGFDERQRAAFQQAVDTWSRILVSPVPIRIDATLSTLEQGVLGAAGPATAFRTTGPDSSYFAVALANSIAGRDLDPQRVDIVAEFSNDPSLIYFGTDGQVPAGQFDFPTIVLHEIGHGIGFFGGLEVVNDVGTYDPGSPEPTPFIFDRFTAQETAEGFRPLLTYPRGSAELGAALRSNAVFWEGENGVAAAGRLPRMYAPADWQPGSSYSHLDELTYAPGSRDALMTPFAARQEVLRDPGPIALGILEDEGWQLSSAADPTPEPSSSPSPATTSAATPAATPSAAFVPPPSPEAEASGGSRYTAVDPRRLLDTRNAIGRVPAGASIGLTVAGGASGVPADATAVVLNVTAVGATQSTDVRVYPETGSGSVPTVSNLNVAGGQTRANLVTVAVGLNGRVRLRNQSGSVHLLADLAGYYRRPSGATFFPLEPARVLDTRSGLGTTSASTTIGPGETIDLKVAGTTRVPGTASAAVLSVTAVGASRSTDIRVYPTRFGNPAVPGVSNVNVVPGGPVPNLVIVRIGDDGRVRLRNNSGRVSLLADVFGYYDLDPAGALFRPLPPQRILDTRPRRLGETELLDLDTSGNGGVPDGATAVALNITGVGASASTDIRLYPTPLGGADTPPSVSTLNLVRGQTAASAAIVRTGNGSAVRFYNNSGSVALLADVAGWFGS